MLICWCTTWSEKYTWIFTFMPRFLLPDHHNNHLCPFNIFMEVANRKCLKSCTFIIKIYDSQIIINIEYWTFVTQKVPFNEKVIHWQLSDSNQLFIISVIFFPPKMKMKLKSIVAWSEFEMKIARFRENEWTKKKNKNKLFELVGQSLIWAKGSKCFVYWNWVHVFLPDTCAVRLVRYAGR